jgi:hypothetical protein
MSTVDNDAVPRRPAWGLIIALAAYGGALVAVAFAFSNQINPDGVADRSQHEAPAAAVASVGVPVSMT